MHLVGGGLEVVGLSLIGRKRQLGGSTSEAANLFLCPSSSTSPTVIHHLKCSNLLDQRQMVPLSLV